MKRRIAQLVQHARAQPPYAAGVARQRPRARQLELTPGIHKVSHREALEHHFLGKEKAVLQTQRGQQALSSDPLESLATQNLDHAAQDAETRVVVVPQVAQRGELRQVYQAVQVALERVVAIAGVDKVVARPATGVLKQVTGGHSSAHLGVGELKVG